MINKISPNNLFIIFSITFIFTSAIINSQTGYTGKKVENFILKDYNGKSYSLFDFKSSKAIVLMFISTECPVSNGYNKRINDLYNSFSGENITFIGINSNKQESNEDIKRNAEENKFDFIILKDVNNILADKLKASVTPEIFILNKNFQIIYHGRIDDSRRENEVKNEDLKNALNAVLKGEKISNPETKAFGCSIKKVN